MVENLFDRKINIFQSHGGWEFDNVSLKLHLQNYGIVFQKSCSRTPEQNEVAE